MPLTNATILCMIMFHLGLTSKLHVDLYIYTGISLYHSISLKVFNIQYEPLLRRTSSFV